MIDFKDALNITEFMADKSNKRLNSLSYSPITGSWTAYFSDDEGSSYAEVTTDTDKMLDDIYANYVPTNPVMNFFNRIIGAIVRKL